MVVSTLTGPSKRMAKKTDTQYLYTLDMNGLISHIERTTKSIKNKQNELHKQKKTTSPAAQKVMDTNQSEAILCLNIICKHKIEQPDGGLSEADLRAALPNKLLKNFNDTGINISFKRVTIKQEVLEEA